MSQTASALPSSTFKVLLAMEDGDAAVQQLKRCMACTNFEPIYLTVRGVACMRAMAQRQRAACMMTCRAQVAAQEACAAGATAVVKSSLLQMYDLATSVAAPEHFSEPGQEGRILRGLIGQCMSGSGKAPAEDVQTKHVPHKAGQAADDTAAPKMRNGADSGSGDATSPKACYIELSGYFNQASRRLAELGTDRFFGDDDGRLMHGGSSCVLCFCMLWQGSSVTESGPASRPRQLEWFAASAWNAGIEAGHAGDHMSSAVLFAASGDFYAAHPSKDGTSLGQQKV